jgi:hypothetical protein
MGPVERIRALGWVQNGKDARAHVAIFQLLAYGQNNYCSMRKGGKTAPAWAKNSCSMGKSGKIASAWAKNSCSMRTKIGASSELLMWSLGARRIIFFKRAAKRSTRALLIHVNELKF